MHHPRNNVQMGYLSLVEVYIPQSAVPEQEDVLVLH